MEMYTRDIFFPNKLQKAMYPMGVDSQKNESLTVHFGTL